jgi:hypothetical protein
VSRARAVEQAERDRRHRSLTKIVFLGESGVHKAMGRTGVDKSLKRDGDGGGRKGDVKGIWVGKSGRVESTLLRCTVGVNATLKLCGVWRAADYFFGSSDAEAFLALAAEELALEHSLATCPPLPQKRQRLLSKRC